jgi:hypothetical protein
VKREKKNNPVEALRFPDFKPFSNIRVVTALVLISVTG